MHVTNETISQIRSDYTLKRFDEKDVQKDPFWQFSLWFDEALRAQVIEPNAMTLGTINSNGFPSTRIVLLKGIEEGGFVFFTNYHSHKGKQLLHNGKASLLFFWPELQRQVRIEGLIHKISEEKSDSYFKTRPRGSQIGAHVSNQSEAIPDRAVLENKVKELEHVYKNQDIPRPLHWGGYCLIPHRFEFWQGRASRLHDRFEFEFKDGNWSISRLSP